MNKVNYGLRKTNSIDKYTDLGLSQVLSLVLNTKTKLPSMTKSTKTNDHNILSDTLFESFDFNIVYLLS